MKKILLLLILIIFILSGCSSKLSLDEYLLLEAVQRYQEALFDYKKAQVNLYENVPDVESIKYKNGLLKIYSDFKKEYDVFIEYDPGELSKQAKELHYLYRRIGHVDLKSNELYLKSYKVEEQAEILAEANKYMKESIALEEELNNFYKEYIY